ncbi:hypothetical protein MAPG_01161 [Magnaporthiopsis poae ATCC 64411]|uniref:Uncharacterized protein n=1 Tax=Magnaporthiopsis poae (strain ATCC 64411 / 73-15) TaxID=644358 RepID=A0A0C4DMZ3_MAGP6|nr:hypothetical protein MAPG_01161 [Magnaporthiopsis poae ATCC 64411]
MRPSIAALLGAVALLGGNALGQDSVPFLDPLTGFTFAKYENELGVSYSVAVPDGVAAGKPYDVVLQMTSRKDLGWFAMAWGGSMTYNPIALSWANGNEAVLTSRMAFGYYVPLAYTDAKYEILPKGTFVNATHFQVTAKCSGCTSWGNDDIGVTYLEPKGDQYFAFAYSSTPVDEPNNPESGFSMHDSTGHWVHSFAQGVNPDFEQLLSKNLAGARPGGGSSRSSSLAAPPDLPFPTSCSSVPAPRFPYTLASGWKATKIAGNLTNPRGLAFDPLGNLLVVQSSYGVSVHTFGANGCINGTKGLILNSGLNHGLAVTPDGKHLYASSMTTVWRWDYDARTRSVSNQVVVIKGMNNGGHSTRALWLAPKNPNIILVQVGSNSNWDHASGNPAEGRSDIRAFDLSKTPAGGYNYVGGGFQMGYGLRNAVGVAFDPNGDAWEVENSGDSFTRTVNGVSTDIHHENPAEELNYLGDPTKPNNQWYGYPTCFTVWDPSVFRDKTDLKTGDQFVVTPNSTFNDAHCSGKAVAPTLSFQAHSAPISGLFDDAGNNMYVTFHGSWNRQPATGYKLVRIPFKKDVTQYRPVAPPNSNKGYEDIMWSVNVERCTSNTCLRPAGLVWDNAKTRLFMGSDNSREGELFIITHEGI